MTEQGLRQHWNNVYTEKSETAVSWYQTTPATSLRLIRALPKGPSTTVLDVGGGASTLVDGLSADGYTDVTVLDIAATALARSRARLGADAGRVQWVEADITTWTPERQWDVWHDRAVFHFLIDAARQDIYITAMRQALAPGGTAIIATFALDGPERCSNLNVQRYSPATLAQRLGDDFRLVSSESEHHLTPWGASQNFAYSVFERR